MIKVENISTWGFEHAIRGMRNPLNSWDKSDSYYCCDENNYEEYFIGSKDLNLMQRLAKAGTDHRKFARQIFISMDITSNHFWWAEMDTYKVGVTRNSCSKMHRIHIKPFEVSDFSHEGIDEVGDFINIYFKRTIETLEWLRVKFNETQEKRYWRALLELLPMGYNIRATITMNYENAMNIINQRGLHKVAEWREFVQVLLKLPYMKDLLQLEKEEDDLK